MKRRPAGLGVCCGGAAEDNALEPCCMAGFLCHLLQSLSHPEKSKSIENIWTLPSSLTTPIVLILACFATMTPSATCCVLFLR